MSKVISARVSDDTFAILDRLAAGQDRSRAWVTARLLDEAAQRALEMEAFVAQGLEDRDAGRTLPHDDMIARLKARHLGPSSN